MKATELRKAWKTKDNTRLAKRAISIRLPTHVTAKIQALCEMHPTKTKTDIMVDLLSSALDEIYGSFEFAWGDECRDERGNIFVKDKGERKIYSDLANKHFSKLEKENGNPNPDDLYEEYLLQKEDAEHQLYGI